MRAVVEIPAFAAVALGAHLALFAAWPGGAPEGAGDGGLSVLSLQGASGAAEAMVASWDAAPEAADAAPRLDAPDRSQSEPPRTAPVDATPLGEGAARLAMPVAPEAVPEVDLPRPVPLPVPELVTALAAPPVPPEADRAPRPAPASGTRPAAVMSAPAPQDAAQPPTVDTASAAPVPATRPMARPEQVARGAGAQGTRGSRAETASPSLSDSARRSLVASWGAEIRARVEAGKIHPAGLRAAGRPVVRITVTRSGTLEAVRIVESSRVAALDEAALRAVRRAGRFPAAPGELDLARASFDLPISFTR